MAETPYMFTRFPDSFVSWEDDPVFYDGDIVTYNFTYAKY